MPLIYSWYSSSLAETEALASKLAPLLGAGDCLTLEGELGVGKTAFARGLITALSEDAPEVTSPTFTLVQSYPVVLAGRRSLCFHADLYRVEYPAELVELGLEEALEQGILLVEWPEIAAGIFPLSRLHIRLRTEAGEQRSIAYHGDASWKLRLGSLSATKDA